MDEEGTMLDKRYPEIQCIRRRAAKSVLFGIMVCSALLSQDRAVLSGIIIDAQTKAPIPLASVLVNGTPYGAASDTSGQFEIPNIPPDLYALEIRHVAYRKWFRAIRLTPGQRISLKVQLQPEVIEQEGVSVTAEQENKRLLNQPYGSTIYTAEEIKKVGAEKLTDLLGTMDQTTASTSRLRRGLDRPPYLIYLDGAYVQYIPGSLDVIVDVHQIDRVEIIRWVGAAPSVGPGTSDKVIYIYTKKFR